MAEFEMPSKVTDRRFVSFPQDLNVVESNDEWRQCGKWVVWSVDRDFVDKAYVALRPMVLDGTLILLKAPTPVMEVNLAVLCFTRPGKVDARRAAEAIRRAVDYRGILYYKPNSLTDDGVAKRHGDKNISIYMHTYHQRFYVKDRFKRWKLDTGDNPGRETSISSQFMRDNYTEVEDLPSSSRWRFLDLRSESYPGTAGGNAQWYMFCSYCVEDDRYLIEADRVWLVSKRLSEEGVFTRISLFEIKIRMYVSEPHDVFSGIETCDRIFKEASVKQIMYFITGEKRLGEKYSYKYTADGELYKTGGALPEEFVSLTRNVP